MKHAPQALLQPLMKFKWIKPTSPVLCFTAFAAPKGTFFGKLYALSREFDPLVYGALGCLLT